MTKKRADQTHLQQIRNILRYGYETVRNESVPDRFMQLFNHLRAEKAPETKASASDDLRAKPPDPREAILEHLPALRAFAMSLARSSDLADDLVQDTVVKAWMNYEKFDPDTNLRAWLFTILRNTFHSHLRKTKREVSDVEDKHAKSIAVKPGHDGRLLLRDFLVALGQLSPEQREVLILIGASGFTYEEAAEICGVALGTIKSRVNRGRRKLAELLSLKEGEAIELTDAQTLAVLSASRTTG